jgi:hypothetical protein
MKRRTFLAATGLGVALSSVTWLESAAATPLRLVKDPNCGCCEGHAAYLQENGFSVAIEESPDLNALRKQHGIGDRFVGCHMIFAQGYVIEGHVPAAAIRKLLADRPAIKGISLPGMPEGSPGMGGPKTAPFVIYEISDGDMRVFMTE